MAQQAAAINPSDSEKNEQARKDPPRGTIAEWMVTFLLLLFGTTTLLQAFVIPTGSMEDNLLIGDHLLVDKLAYSPSGAISKYLLPYQEPKHGDIIVFRYPADISQTFVKRVIGVPGDHLKIVNQQVYRNGKLLVEPYIYHKLGVIDAYKDNFPGEPAPYLTPDQIRDGLLLDMLTKHVSNGEVVVPPNSYFAMGDNRDNSLDSRFWGFVPRDNIIGKPLLIYWSYEATTAELTGSSVGDVAGHFVDVVTHFFSRTRWPRTLHVIRGFPDSQLPSGQSLQSK